MSGHFNNLTPAQAERLAMLAEECGEVIQVIGKILRHGFDSRHPHSPEWETNRFLLGKEMNDVLAVWQQMQQRDSVMISHLFDTHDAWQKKLRYAHHQDAGDQP